MAKYANLGGNSGVVSYEIGDDRITVVFEDGDHTTYIYSYVKPGSYHVEEMKKLARAGQGLNAYIKRYIDKNYESRS